MAKSASGKPVIFFSHSSKDKDLLMPIRERLLKATAGSIELFMSSDGSSIPFGHNWVKSIEDALKRCQVMFVWLTAQSYSSKWISFESGYAYARGIEVVPVGFAGLTLDDLSPPISLLQGFDVNSAESLNNVTATINRVCSLSFEDVFDDDFYESVIQRQRIEDAQRILEFARVLSIRNTFIATSNIRSVQDIAKGILDRRGIKYSSTQEYIEGVGFNINFKAIDGAKPIVTADVTVDPIAINTLMGALQDLSNASASNGVAQGVFIRILPTSTYALPENSSTVGARLLDSEVYFEPASLLLYRFRNIFFELQGNDIYIWVPDGAEPPLPIVPLLDLLVARRVIERR